MKEMKQLLTFYQSVFILGTNSSERYQVFLKLVDSQYKQLLKELVSRKVECPIIFFPDDDYQAFIEKEGSFLPLTSQSLVESSIECMYIPIPTTKVPNSFIYIFPPSLGNHPFELIEDPFTFDDEIWIGNIDKLIWMESFPYGQRDGIKILEELNASSRLSRIDLSISFVKSGRRFGYSDLTTEDRAIELAKDNYLEKKLCRTVSVLDQDDSIQQQLSDLIYTRSSYKQLVKNTMKNEFALEYDSYKDFFEEQYEFLVRDKLSIERLDDIFSYKAWKKDKSQNVVSFWMSQLDQELVTQWRSLFKEMVNDYLREIDIVDRTKEVDRFLEKKWDKKMKKLITKYNFTVNLPDGIDEVSYMAEIKTIKVQMKQEFVNFLFKDMKISIKDLIDSRFKVWEKIL